MLLEDLSNAFGPSGCEDEVRRTLARALHDKVDNLQIDALGNLIAFKQGTGPALWGHMIFMNAKGVFSQQIMVIGCQVIRGLFLELPEFPGKEDNLQFVGHCMGQFLMNGK